MKDENESVFKLFGRMLQGWGGGGGGGCLRTSPPCT